MSEAAIPEGEAPASAPLSVGVELAKLNADRQKRTKRALIAAGVSVLVLGVGLVVHHFATRSDLPAIDAKRLKEVQDALPALSQIAVEHRHELGFSALSELEGGRLPAPLVTAFEKAGQGFPGARSRVLLEALADPGVALEWSKTCPAGPGALATMISVEPAAQGRTLYKTCGFDRLGYLSEDEGAKVEGPVLAATALAHDYLKRHRALSETEVALLRMAAVDSFIHAREKGPLSFQF